jgi:hypothetical protein
MIKNLKTNILYLFICLITFSCSSQNSVKDNIKKMKDSPICITENNMKKWVPKNYNSTNKVDTKKFSFIVYADSSQCSPCCSNIKSSLELAGNNRRDLESVLEHFEHDPNPLKYEAAKFLIENLPFHQTITGETAEKYAEACDVWSVQKFNKSIK